MTPDTTEATEDKSETRVPDKIVRDRLSTVIRHIGEMSESINDLIKRVDELHDMVDHQQGRNGYNMNDLLDDSEE